MLWLTGRSSLACWGRERLAGRSSRPAQALVIGAAAAVVLASLLVTLGMQTGQLIMARQGFFTSLQLAVEGAARVQRTETCPTIDRDNAAEMFYDVFTTNLAALTLPAAETSETVARETVLFLVNPCVLAEEGDPGIDVYGPPERWIRAAIPDTDPVEYTTLCQTGVANAFGVGHCFVANYVANPFTGETVIEATAFAQGTASYETFGGLRLPFTLVASAPVPPSP